MRRSWGKWARGRIWRLRRLERICLSITERLETGFQSRRFSLKIKQRNTTELTRLYSSLFPTSSSSSLCSWERDLTEATDNIEAWNQIHTNSKRTHTHTILAWCTYSGKYVSMFSRSSSDTKLTRLERTGKEKWLQNSMDFEWQQLVWIITKTASRSTFVILNAL